MARKLVFGEGVAHQAGHFLAEFKVCNHTALLINEGEVSQPLEGALPKEHPRHLDTRVLPLDLGLVSEAHPAAAHRSE